MTTVLIQFPGEEIPLTKTIPTPSSSHQTGVKTSKHVQFGYESSIEIQNWKKRTFFTFWGGKWKIRINGAERNSIVRLIPPCQIGGYRCRCPKARGQRGKCFKAAYYRGNRLGVIASAGDRARGLRVRDEGEEAERTLRVPTDLRGGVVSQGMGYAART